MWNSSLRTASGTNTDVQRRALYLRAFKFWPIRIHFERGQAVIYACGTCGSRSRRGNNSRARGQEERSGSSGVTKRGIERRARERKRERGGRERERGGERYKYYSTSREFTKAAKAPKAPTTCSQRELRRIQYKDANKRVQRHVIITKTKLLNPFVLVRNCRHVACRAR